MQLVKQKSNQLSVLRLMQVYASYAGIYLEIVDLIVPWSESLVAVVP